MASKNQNQNPNENRDPFTTLPPEKEPESPVLLSGSYIDLSLDFHVYSYGSHQRRPSQSHPKRHKLRHSCSSTSTFETLSRSTILNEMESEKQELLKQKRKLEEAKAIEKAQWDKDREGGMAGWERNCPFGDHVSINDCVTGDDGVMRPRTKDEAESRGKYLEGMEEERVAAERQRVEHEMLVDDGRLAEELTNAKLEDEEAAGEFEEGWVSSVEDEDEDEDETDPTTASSCRFSPSGFRDQSPKPSPDHEPEATHTNESKPSKSSLRKRVKRGLGKKTGNLVSIFEGKEKGTQQGKRREGNGAL